jgi:hypothetical protein
LQSIARHRLRDNGAQRIQRRKIPAGRPVRHHQADHPAINLVSSREPQRERRQQRHSCRSQRPRHRRQRRHDKDNPREQRPPALDQARRPCHDAPDGAVAFCYSEQISNTDQQHQQVNREPAVHLLHAFAHKDRAHEVGHHQSERPKIDGPQRANQEDKDKSAYSDDVNGQSSLRLAPELERVAIACADLFFVAERRLMEAKRRRLNVATNSQQSQPSLRDWGFLPHSAPALIVFEN